MSDGYQVDKDKEATIDSYELAMWVEVYCKDVCDGVCMSEAYADKLGVDKTKATMIAHRIARRVMKGCVWLGHV